MSEKQTPLALLKARGKVDSHVVAVLVNGKTVDLHTPIDPSLPFTPVLDTEPAGLRVIRHSTAHVMADAVQRLFPGTHVTIGPAIDDGFYYDFEKQGGGFTEEDLRTIEAEMIRIVNADTPFRREVVSRDEALKMFTAMGEHFKVEIIQSIPEGEEISLYRHGFKEGLPPGQAWVDVCEGPHVPSTRYLKAVRLTHVAGAYWRGDEKNPMLQRIYGTAFASKEALAEHLRLIEEARARDHRKLGKELDLFLFNEVAPAMPFFLPKGAYVYNRMVDYVRNAYEAVGYEEVITPQAFDPSLFRTSGHLGHYNENMYRVWTEDLIEGVPDDKLRETLQQDSFGIKPMNCPSHCVIFGSRRRSYRELPWRVADFGRLHRYERGGVVHGLSRVRTFCQDDAHIFCTKEQVAGELELFLKFFYGVYRAFKFEKIAVKLATRPEKRLGTDADWDMAEASLEDGLKRAGIAYEILPGEGAFYGPKLEFHVEDALKRAWQLGTFQLDPNLPERFDLTYTGDDGKDHRPVMLHRAIFGSLERFFSIYLEHVAGNFPTWISPRQAILLTVIPEVDDYAYKVLEGLKAQGFRVDIDSGRDKLGAKIRNARLARYPYLAVIGAKEAEAGTLGVRSREAGELGPLSVADFTARLKAEAAPPSMDAPAATPAPAAAPAPVP
jgi:threonyl-tRNA synthetase